LRNSGYSGNFNGNGARKTVCLSDTKRARHGRDQMPVLRGDFVQRPVIKISGRTQDDCPFIFKNQFKKSYWLINKIQKI
jgi:hypothetical protein